MTTFTPVTPADRFALTDEAKATILASPLAGLCAEFAERTAVVRITDVQTPQGLLAVDGYGMVDRDEEVVIARHDDPRPGWAVVPFHWLRKVGTLTP